MAKQSPKSNVIEVLEVGTMPVISDSLTLGSKSFMSLAFKSKLSDFEATPIILILKRFAYFNILDNSVVLPEYDNTIKISFFSI